MTVAAIVTAAGTGSRMKTDPPKQFLPLAGIPILARTLRVLEDSPGIDMVYPVVPQGNLRLAEELIARYGPFSKCRPPIPGGRRRQDSVREGFKLCSGCRMVVVHDGARPLLTPDLVGRCLDAAGADGAALCAVRPAETVKYSEDGHTVSRSLDRRLIWLAQTPQAFRGDLLAAAYNAVDFGIEFTDEASMIEAAGYPVSLVAGSPVNIKITSRWDLAVAELILDRMESGGDLA